MIPKPIEAKAFLWRENDRWVLGVELAGWLAFDLLRELEHRALVDLTTTLDLNELNTVEFIQLPLAEEGVRCENCGARVTLARVEVQKTPTWLGLWSDLWKLLKRT